MSSSRVIAKRRQFVLIGHICSHCKVPVVATVLISAEAQKTYSFSQSKAAEIAGDTANEAIQSEIRRIKSCRTSRCVLYAKADYRSMISPGHFRDSSISGFDRPCPNCRKLELWKNPSASRRELEELGDENFPSVFQDNEAAEEWAQKANETVIAQIEQARLSAEAVSAAKKEAVVLYLQVERLKKQRDSIPELIQRAQLMQENALLTKQKEKIGLLDLKGRREVNSKLKILSLRLRDIDRVIHDKQDKINLQIIEKKVQLQKAQQMAYGCAGGSLVVGGAGMAYFPIKANEIPAEDLAQYEPMEPAPQENAESRPLFCRKCGVSLMPDSIFCRRCGAKV